MPEFKGFMVFEFDEEAGSAGDKLTAIIEQKMATDKNLSFSAAFAEAQTDNPDLAAEYATEIFGC